MIIGPSVSSCWEDSPAKVWIISINSHYCSLDNSSLIQVWSPKSGSIEPQLLQEFEFDASAVTDMGWKEIDDKWILYVINRYDSAQKAGTVCTFSLNFTEPYLRIVSEDRYDDLIWIIQSPTKISNDPIFYEISYPSGSPPPGQPVIMTLNFITHSQYGYFTSQHINMSDILQDNEFADSSAEDLRTIITYRLKYSDDWLESLSPGSGNIIDRRDEKYNSDRTPYYSSFMGSWMENIIHYFFSKSAISFG